MAFGFEVSYGWRSDALVLLGTKARRFHMRRVSRWCERMADKVAR